MSKFTYRLILMLAALTLLLAACGPAAPNGAGGVASPDVPETGAGADMPETGAGLTGPCVDVDTQQLMTGGLQLYEARCASCHGEQGEGVGGFPALSGNADVVAADVVQLVQGYFAVEAHPQDLMPEDLAALFTYTRSSFGNTGEVVCPADIQIPVTQ